MLKKRGWRYWVVGKGQGEEQFWAERDGWDLSATSPVELLGLVMIYETKQPQDYTEYWWREQGPDVLSRIPTKAPKYRSKIHRS